MTSENLTRAECAERAQLITGVSYAVDLDLSNACDDVDSDEPGLFGSTTVVTFDCNEPGASSWIDLIAAEVYSISLNGVELETASYDGARIGLPNLAARNELRVSASCHFMRTGEGLHRFVDPVDREVYLYSQFEVADARRVYACFEQPSLKAEWQLSVTAPAHWTVLSNSPTPAASSVDDDGNRGPTSLPTARWEFAPTPRISTYITAIIAGPYHGEHSEYAGPHGTYPLGVYCRRSLAEHLDAEEIFELTRQGFEFYEREFATAYPFGKYDQIFVPEFNAGAMENAACVTFLEDYVFRSRTTAAAYEARANTILHELAHMWFGNLVTMTWWDDLWLNESFAEWASHHANAEATKYRDAWTTFLNQRKTWAYRQDQLPSTHPIAANMIDLDAVRINFDGITYAKGAAALRQLVAYVGQDNFIAGLRRYFADHAWSNTEFADLLKALNVASGRQLDDWARLWLQTSGVNTIRPHVRRTADSTAIESLSLVQEAPNSPGSDPVLRPHRLAIGVYSRDGELLTRQARVEVDLIGSSVDVAALAGEPAGDVVIVNDDDLTFAKVRLDDASLETAITAIDAVADSLTRALLWGSLWDMTRDAQLSTGDYVAAVTRGLGREPDVGVVAQILRQAGTSIDLYATEANAAHYRHQLTSSLHTWIDDAPAGSDHQLAFVRAFSGLATSEADLDWVGEVLSGRNVPDGLQVDADLRWRLLERLVIMGRAHDGHIDTELDRDPTSMGQRWAATCRAAIPSREAKAAAWNRALNPQKLANHILVATIAGIMHPEHRGFLNDHVDAYFAALPRLWSSLTHEMAQEVTAGLYPMWLVAPSTITTTESFLASESAAELPPAARRILSEQLDAVMRAMSCQERDSR